MWKSDIIRGRDFVVIAGLETHISITGVASLAFLCDILKPRAKRHLPERVGFMFAAGLVA